MLISEFARATGLTTDTIRFYVRKGLLKPETTSKGGSNPYQIFTQDHVETAKMIRMSQTLGFSLKELSANLEAYQAGKMPSDRAAEIVRTQVSRLESRAAELDLMIKYLKVKLAWIEGGSEGAGPAFPLEY